MADLERREDKALRDEIAVAIHEADCGCTQFYQRHEDPTRDAYYESLADSVLPVVQAHEKALRDLSVQTLARAIKAEDDMAVCPIQVTCFTAMRDLASLREAVAQLADDLDDEVQSITNVDAGALGRRGGLRDAARDVRSLLPQEGPQQ